MSSDQHPVGAGMEFEPDSDWVARFVRFLGVFFLAAGLGLLLVLLVSLVQLLSEPGEVFSIGLIAEFLQADSPALSVVVDGREALINIDQPLRLVLVLFVGAVTILSLGSVLHACIGGGLSLLRFVRKRSNDGGD